LSRTPDAESPAVGLVEPDIRRLLEEPGRLNLVGQPIIDLRRGAVVGYEILSRFRLEHPTSPDRVFAAAARQGLGAELEARVIERALVLAETLPDNCFLSVNVDPTLLTTARVLDALQQRPSLAGIVFELTEHTAIEDLAGVISAVAWLRERGCRWSASSRAGSTPGCSPRGSRPKVSCACCASSECR
jgi:EAL domain-containing protein (putative c-di-GMP-specific phosphodiesterase class I)